MNFKKITASVAAGAMALAMTAIGAFAQTIELDAEYPGAWGCGQCISKADLEAVGSDVKVTLTVEAKSIIPDQMVVKPMDYDNGWTAVTDYLTSDTAVRKPDGFIYVTKSQTSVEFVIPADTISTLGDSGLGFQVYNVTVKSADIEAGSPEADMKLLADEYKIEYCQEEATYEELSGDAAPAEDTEEAPAEETEAAPAEEEAPAEETEAAPAEEEAPAEEIASDDTTAPADDGTTDAAATGNVPAGVMIAVMAVSAAAALTVKKSK